MLEILYGQASDAGKVRSTNEDSMAVFVPRSQDETHTHGFLFLVADGVGGLHAGEVASATAVQTVADGYAGAEPCSGLGLLLPQLLEHANRAIHKRAGGGWYGGKKMATTLVALALRQNEATICHVGDSRCYRIRNGKVMLLTNDHTWVNEQIKLGLLTAEEAAKSNARHMLLRALGADKVVVPETAQHTLDAGDVFVLCSDGVHDRMPEHEMVRIVQQKKTVGEVAQDLVLRAVELDGGDNATAQVIRVLSKGASWPDGSRASV